MADYIDREELLKMPFNCREIWDGKTPDYQLIDTIDVDIIKNLSSLDVVRCKDCKYRDKMYCTYLPRLPFDRVETPYHKVSDTDYCSWGERK